ncbi:hypothetical protein E8E13_005573 [Curvularia kusanoi]|uniref:N-acetyltransferase domain-containing protein n=1 Tax=Curvularia kusanoi TaxID=90978 RepID=A0A9P4T9N5_CURKU|nr:hypothetical protein E8E13_005573 [Curvularia kusanoi]
MARFDFCSRADMPSSAPPVLDIAMETRQRGCARTLDSLTWQQQEDLGKQKSHRRGRKGRKFVPLDFEAYATEPETATEYHTARTEQAQIAAPEASDSTPPPPLHGNSSGKRRRNRKKGKVDSGRKSGEMQAKQGRAYVPLHLRQSEDVVRNRAYIPPHLRKKDGNATQLGNEVRLGDCIAIASPPASAASQAEKGAEAEAPPIKAVAPTKTPISPPKTAGGSPIPVAENGGWDDSKPGPHRAPTKPNGNNRWPKGLKEPYKKHVWIKTRDIPRNTPTESGSGGGVSWKSDSGGDPSYDVKKLMDWNGDWLPPPEDWVARKGFHPRHFGQAVEKWLDEHSKQCIVPVRIDSPDFLGVPIGDGKFLTKDLVPRYWLHDSIDNAAPRKFWDEFPQRAPAPLTDVDIVEHPPYWERWQEGEPENNFMAAVTVPEARVDAGDIDNESKSPYAMISTEERVRRILELRDKRRLRTLAKQNRPVTVTPYEGPPLPDRSLKPKCNIYIRPVQPSDVAGITDIYNHYVDGTVQAEELEKQTIAQIREWIDGVVQAGLPCLVAILKRNLRKKPQGYVSETVVGWVHLESYGAAEIYRFTTELALYVHPGYIRQGVGKCLLDQMMTIANTGYNKKGGYEYVNDFEYLKTGKSQIVKTIIVRVLYERGDDTEWAANYLGEYGFRKAGRMSQMGCKLNKMVDVALFQTQTAEIIELNNVPMIQG